MDQLHQHNLGAGPCILPLSVTEDVAQALLNWNGIGRNVRLGYFDDQQGWKTLLSKLTKNLLLIVFTLFAIGYKGLMGYSDQELMLPLKFSCILPKGSFGLLMQDLNSEKDL